MQRDTFYSTVRHTLFGGKLNQAQVDGMEGILNAFDTHGDGKADTLAYAMATAYHETGRRMVPVRETFATSDDQAIRRLDKWAKKKGRTSNVYWRRQTSPHVSSTTASNQATQRSWSALFCRMADFAKVATCAFVTFVSGRGGRLRVSQLTPKKPLFFNKRQPRVWVAG